MPLPFSDLERLYAKKLNKIREEGRAFEFGHRLEDQIGGQLKAGFVITNLYEDNWDNEATPPNPYCPTYIPTLARKVRTNPDQ